MNPLSMFSRIWPFVRDASDDWAEFLEPPTELELQECRDERAQCDAAPPLVDVPNIVRYPVVDLQDAAARVQYRNGKVKRTRYRPNDLAKLKVVISLHQAGVERPESRWQQSAHRVTCHRAIGPTGVRYKVHPLETRLVSTNRFDRSPYACIAIEFLGNFEGTDGSGRWYQPERFGAGRATDAQIEAGFIEVGEICEDVRSCGAEAMVVAIGPHIVAGRDKRGQPNRQFCCGSRQWSLVGERAGAELDLAVPGPDFSLGGLPIPDSWHGPYWPQCKRFL